MGEVILEGGGLREISVPSAQFHYEPETALKKKAYLKKQRTRVKKIARLALLHLSKI